MIVLGTMVTWRLGFLQAWCTMTKREKQHLFSSCNINKILRNHLQTEKEQDIQRIRFKKCNNAKR
jgi:hypothetical protein